MRSSSSGGKGGENAGDDDGTAAEISGGDGAARGVDVGIIILERGGGKITTGNAGMPASRDAVPDAVEAYNFFSGHGASNSDSCRDSALGETEGAA